MNSNRILFVEDDVNLRFLYKQEFEDDGYEVDVSNSGSKALKMVNEKTYDLVVLDIFMPEMDGLEFLSKLLVKDNSMRTIINTAYPSYKDNYMSWAADAYVVKSSNITELKEKIKESVYSEV